MILIIHLIYWPLARLALLADLIGISINSFPPSYYRKLGLYIMRTEALDHFETQLEKRFSKNEIAKLIDNAEPELITFSNHKPYWIAIGYKR